MSDPLEQLCELADSFFTRGYAFGSTGNLSVRVDDTVYVTPTGKPLRGLKPDMLAAINLDGDSKNAVRPSKEFPFHLAAYRNHEGDCGAIVHLHSTYTVALSCLAELDSADPLPSITPYYFMRVAPMGIVPYFRPGSIELGDAVGEAARAHKTILLRNHGSICLGRNLSEAADRAEELEETAKLHFILRGENVRTLTPEEIHDIQRTFVLKS